MKLRLSAALDFVAVAAIPLAGHVAAGADDPLGCGLTIFDPADLVDDEVLRRAIESTGSGLGADVRVRVERAVDGSLETRLDQLVRQCPGWQAADGELADDMVVVMFSRAEREASVYYGADQGPRLEDRWEPAVDAMILELRTGDYTGAVDAALRVLRTGPSSGLVDTPRDDRGDSGDPAIPVMAVVLVLVVVGVLLLQGYRVANGDATWSALFDDGDDSGWYSSGSRSSWRSWSGGGGGGSSRSSSGGGSRSAGGGSKKW